MASTPKAAPQNRRSTRVKAQIPLCVSSVDPSVTFSEHCHTLVVNLQGCGVRLSQPLGSGVAVLLDELPSGQTATAHVANAVPLGANKKYWLVGLALDEPGNVWGIHPAPADWGQEPVVAAAVVTPQKSQQEWAYERFSAKGEFHGGKK
ncbi:MAG TPA: PilZ domain-containing protein [Terriglobales bacterium]|nr:PilZ domain-containing protein [Terriglobales bacterium]